MVRPAAPDVVVVTHRGGPLLARCVEALRHQTLAPAAVRVVLSAAEDPPLPADVDVVRLGANVGFARAANAGLRTAAGRPVVLLNDDTVPAPRFVEALARAEEQGGPGIYQPHIVLADRPGRVDNTGHRLFPDGFNLARGRGRPDRPGRAGAIGAFSGAAVLFSPEVLTAVGAFDEDLEAFGEDVDLSLRAVRRGYAVRYVPEARIGHALGATYGRGGARKVYLVERNRVRAAVRSLPATAVLTMPAWTGLRLASLGAAAAAGRGVGATAGARGAVAAAAGALAGLAAIPDALRKRRADRGTWTLGEAAMWRHLLTHAVRPADLLAPRP
jgi:GT2 family glycosyltransferase